MNELKQIREKLNITQIEAAKILNVSRRSYQMYESQSSNSEKYDYLVEKLKKYNLIDEEHGILSIEQIKSISSKIFENYDIKCCYLFGSYAKNKATDKSDVDLLIDSSITGLKYFGLVEELRVALCKKIDLLNVKELVKNEALMCEILKDGIKIYG